MPGDVALGADATDAILAASPDAVLVVDAAGEVVFANATVEALFGYDPETLLGEPVEVLVPEAVRDDHEAAREGYMEAPECRPMGASLELTGQRQDGTEFPVDVSLSPLTHDGAEYAIAVVRDRRHREALETKYRSILDAVPDPVVIADAATGEIVEANDKVRDVLGYDQAALEGDLQTVLHPTGQEARYRAFFERHVEAGQSIFTAFPDGDPLYVETAAGDRVPVEINAEVFELDGRELVAGAFRDISRRRQREQALERLHGATRELFSASTTDEVARIVSETATEVLDLAMNGVHRYDGDADALVPVAWSDSSAAVFGDEPPAIERGEGIAWEVYASGEPAMVTDVHDHPDALDPDSRFRSELVQPIGDYGLLLVSATTVEAFDATDEALVRVLAANAEAAIERVEREEKLRSQNERLDNFVGIVSHDLRNPLNVATGHLDLAREECDSDHLDAVADAQDRMAGLVDDLLELARRGDDSMALTTVSLADAVRNCWTHVDTETASLTVHGDRTLRADRSRLKQLLENLLRNAVEHGGEDVTVTVGLLPDGFYVEDDGPGFETAAPETLFEAGYSTGEAGTGLGLSIVHEVAQAHDWAVRATTGEAGGARFEISGVGDVGSE